MAGAWRKTLIYLGLVEDDEPDEYGYEDEPAPEPAPRSISRSPEPRPARRDAVVRTIPTPPSARFHLVSPAAFNDAQEIGDKYREGFSVIMNLAGASPDIARRLVDFASGLAYGLAGSMQQVADRVFLLTPRGVQVSAEERRRFLEERGFFNQA
ncbi:MAG: cell division inhibitor SepF [Actinomycetota bacterium]|jgi:cell division inhibitor SepF|nr:cell division inhibitor SepF [Actinomycetota bacterium]